VVGLTSQWNADIQSRRQTHSAGPVELTAQRNVPGPIQLLQTGIPYYLPPTATQLCVDIDNATVNTNTTSLLVTDFFCMYRAKNLPGIGFFCSGSI
jgi:hypothetical protein